MEQKNHLTDQCADKISNDVIEILSCGTDYYKVLKLDSKFDKDELKKSYRKLALKFHPDKNNKPGANEAFRLISRAFTVLSDPTKKILYDINGDDSFSPVSDSDSRVSQYFCQTTHSIRKQQKSSSQWSSIVLKVSPILILLAYSIVSGLFTKKKLPAFTTA